MNSATKLFDQFRLLTLCVLVCASAWPLAAFAESLVSTVDRNELTVNQTLRLTVTYDEQASTSALDTSMLASEFDILGISPQTSSSTTMVNGVTQSSVTTRWSITLAPKREGRLMIPSFTLGAAKSQPISINVVSAAQSSSSDAATQPLAVSVSVEPETVYAEQQAILTVQLVISQRLTDLGGSQLAIEGGEIVPLGQQTFQQLDNGIATQVVELRYAIFPDKPGTITIPQLKYTGRLGGRRSLFDAFGMNGEQVIARSQPVSINVLPRVDKPGTHWLPAKSVTLSEDWSASVDRWQVGQPLTRTVTVRVDQQRSASVPPLPMQINDAGFKVYQDQPKLDDGSSDKGIVGTRIESAALVPSQSGELVLSEVRLPWFNTETEVWEEAILPARTLTILPGSGQSSEASDPMTETVVEAPSKAEIAPAPASSSRVWQITAGLLAMVVAVFGYLIVRLRGQLNRLQQRLAAGERVLPGRVPQSESRSWTELEQQLQQPVTFATRDALHTWLRSALQAAASDSLHTLAVRSGDARLPSLMTALDRMLFRGQGEVSATELAAAVSELRNTLASKASAQKSREDGLPPLYPE